MGTQSHVASFGHGSLSTDFRFMTQTLGLTISWARTVKHLKNSSKHLQRCVRRVVQKFASTVTTMGITTRKSQRDLSSWRTCTRRCRKASRRRLSSEAPSESRLHFAQLQFSTLFIFFC